MRRILFAKLLIAFIAVAATVFGVHTLFHQLWITMTATLVASVLLAAIGASSIGSRLDDIIQFADRIAQGDLSARIQHDNKDELDRVAVSLNHTAERLREEFSTVEGGRRELETLLNSMQDAVIAMSGDGRVQWVNQQMNRLVFQRPRIGVGIVETIRDPEFLTAVREAAETQTVRVARSTTIVPGRFHLVTAAPLPGGGVMAVLRDLTETERTEKMRRDFIANVSHELRTPLTSIQGYTETLLDSLPEADTSRDFLEIIRKNASRMSRLTEDLLTLARVESGEHHFDREAVLPADLLSDAMQSFDPIGRAMGIKLEMQAEVERAVLADPEAIHQIFANLIDNAMKYGATGGKVVVGARPANGQNGQAEFYVQDFGSGIGFEHLPRLFERFYRVDKARSRESGGTGLGLAIAKHIVLAHGGTIRAESEMNHGAAFIFTLPYAEHENGKA